MKNWKYITTNYRESWLTFRRSEEYRKLLEVLKDKGIPQPYSGNILKQAFAAGWRGSGKKITILE